MVQAIKETEYAIKEVSDIRYTAYCHVSRHCRLYRERFSISRKVLAELVGVVTEDIVNTEKVKKTKNFKGYSAVLNFFYQLVDIIVTAKVTKRTDIEILEVLQKGVKNFNPLLPDKTMGMLWVKGDTLAKMSKEEKVAILKLVRLYSLGMPLQALVLPIVTLLEAPTDVKGLLCSVVQPKNIHVLTVLGRDYAEEGSYNELVFDLKGITTNSFTTASGSYMDIAATSQELIRQATNDSMQASNVMSENLAYSAFKKGLNMGAFEEKQKTSDTFGGSTAFGEIASVQGDTQGFGSTGVFGFTNGREGLGGMSASTLYGTENVAADEQSPFGTFGSFVDIDEGDKEPTLSSSGIFKREEEKTYTPDTINVVRYVLPALLEDIEKMTTQHFGFELTTEQIVLHCTKGLVVSSEVRKLWEEIVRNCVTDAGFTMTASQAYTYVARRLGV